MCSPGPSDFANEDSSREQLNVEVRGELQHTSCMSSDSLLDCELLPSTNTPSRTSQNRRKDKRNLLAESMIRTLRTDLLMFRLPC